MIVSWPLFSSGVWALILFAMLAPSSAQAQTHSELQTMVQQLQANPSDIPLRERVIATARQLKPAPAIPEAAREKFVAGTTIAQSAKDAAGQALAVQRFEEALKIAPWWGDALYNLAVAQELAGQLDAAQTSLKLYLLTGLTEDEARKAQDQIYKLKAKKDLASAEAANSAAQTKAREQADREAIWNGSWTSYHASGSSSQLLSRKSGNVVEFYPEGWSIPLYRGRFESDGRILWEQSAADHCGWSPLQMEVSSDARTLTLWEQTLDASTCRFWNDRSLRTIRRN